MLYIVSADYDTNLGCIVLRLYDTESCKLEPHYDTAFLPYFYAQDKQNFEGIVKQEQVEMYDALHDKKIKVWKVTCKTPLVITFAQKKLVNVWENHIKTFMSYIYDNDIKMGMPYFREKGVLFLNTDKNAEERVKELTKLVNPPEYNQIITEELARLLEYPAPNFKRTSLDIEVLNEGQKVPSPSAASLPIICVCLVSNTGEKTAFVLVQDDKPFSCPVADKILWFSDEAELLEALFEHMKQYPFVVTFNGDDFDLPYLMNRALRLGVPAEKIPITYEEKQKISYWKGAIHIDLYKFFSIKSMQTYAFQSKYKVIDLDTISLALLGEGKLKGEHSWVGDMTYDELLTYCFKDGDLTVRLTTFSDNLVMNLILVLARLSYMPIELASRKPISQWIRSMIYYEHRKRNWIIPRSEDIIEMKGQAISKALIKGKKYKGAVVVNPIAGFHFCVKVGDFASLYPSIMKNWNLGYSTVNCPHGQLYQKMLNNTENFISATLQKCSIGCVKDCPVKEFIRLLKEKKEQESVEEKAMKNSNEKTQNDSRKCLDKEQNIQKIGVNETQRNVQNERSENLKNSEDKVRKNESDSLTKEETNVNDVGSMIAVLLKSTTLTDTEKEEKRIYFSKKIGLNYNCCVQIVIELFTAYNCWNNKEAKMPHWICKKNRAIESQLIGTLKDLRVKWYKQKAKEKDNPQKAWYSTSEQSIKVICNAAYGVFGDEDFVLYCPPFPEEITGIGRWIIGNTIQHAQELGLNVLYGDTDSIFIKNPPKEVLEELLKWAKAQYDIEFELDKSYRYICLSTRKKNYLGVFEDGRVDVKGLTGKKKHTPKLIKGTFDNTKKLLAEIYTEADIQDKRKAILKLVKSTYMKFKTRKFDSMEELAFHVTMSKNIEGYGESEPQHVKAAKQLKAVGVDVGEGYEVSYVKTHTEAKVKPTALAKPEDVDVDKYIEFLKTTFIQILEPLGLDWDQDILGCVVLDSFPHE